MRTLQEFKCYFISTSVVIWQLFVYQIEAATCSACPSISLGSDQKEILFCPNYEYMCSCEWTLPPTVQKDDTAVVFLLRDYLLSATTTNDLSCTGRFKFPGSDRYKCNLPANYCSMFVTGSTTCNISQLQNQIFSSNNQKCDLYTFPSIAGGSPNKIVYQAPFHAGYLNYFRIQYFPMKCEETTLVWGDIPEATIGPVIAQNEECKNGKILSQSESSSIIKYKSDCLEKFLKPCQWTIRKPEHPGAYALVVNIVKFHVPITSFGCSGYLRLPGTNYFCNNHSFSTCHIYTSTNCDIQKLKKDTKKLNGSCKNHEVFNTDVKSDNYEIIFDVRTTKAKELTINVDYIPCYPDSTPKNETPYYADPMAEDNIMNQMDPIYIIPIAIGAFILGTMTALGLYCLYKKSKPTMNRKPDNTKEEISQHHRPAHANPDMYEIPRQTRNIQNRNYSGYGDAYESSSYAEGGDFYEEYDHTLSNG